MKLSSLLPIAAVAAQALFLSTPSAWAQSGDSPTHRYAESRPVPGRYIVVFKDSVDGPGAAAASIMQGSGGQLHHTYTGALKGFAATLPEAALQGIRNNPLVEYIEQDQSMSLNQVASPQNQATWGLDRIDQADRPLDTQYYFSQTGAGVYAFILDTGVRADHVEFAGRMRPGYSPVKDGNGTNDCHGHGTHVAGTVAASTWGVAKGAWIVPVRVADCTGWTTWSNLIAGIDWVANSGLRPAVANISIGGTASSSLDSAVAGAVNKGVTIVVAAGNSNVDACGSSPARAASAITVGATSNADARASYSNYGSCVDIFAPGNGITSTYYSSSTASALMSGTSMASPHVAGVVALMLQANPTASPAAVTSALTSNATPNRLTSIGTGSPNLLVYSMAGGGSTAPMLQPATLTVAFVSMSGSAVRNGGNWKASAVVTIRDINSGAPVANATASGGFSPGGNASCVTASNGSCTLTSSPIKSKEASTVLTATGITGTLLKYDATQNAVTQIVISKP
jgi:aqualysin 1